MEELLSIDSSQEWRTVDRIDKGWSGDVKYHITKRDSQELLLRVSDISLYDRKKKEYEAMMMLNGCEVLMSRPVDFGICNKGRNVFVLLTWIDGSDAEEILPTMSPKEQYTLGYDVGRALRRIHSVPAPPDQIDWEVRFNRKIDRKIKDHEACVIKIDGADKIINYINENRPLLKHRTQTFQHGDFHVGNMVITEENRIGIIDFNRYDYGDPWEEFNRIVWCAGVSRYFASGRINGYFADDVPELFFRLMALYIGSNTLSSVPWAVPFGETEVKTMLDQARDVLAWYDDFRTCVPNWYCIGL